MLENGMDSRLNYLIGSKIKLEIEYKIENKKIEDLIKIENDRISSTNKDIILTNEYKLVRI